MKEGGFVVVQTSARSCLGEIAGGLLTPAERRRDPRGGLGGVSQKARLLSIIMLQIKTYLARMFVDVAVLSRMFVNVHDRRFDSIASVHH